MGDIEARREARRRKILENAENRMRKITNSVGKPGIKLQAFLVRKKLFKLKNVC